MCFAEEHVLAERQASTEHQSKLKGKKPLLVKLSSSKECKGSAAAPRSNPATARKRRVLYTVLVITLLYVVCFIPGSIMSQIMYWDTAMLLDAGHYGGILIRYMQLLFNLNFVLSPFVYAIMAEKFRKEIGEFWDKLKATYPILNCINRRDSHKGANLDEPNTVRTEQLRMADSNFTTNV